MRKICLEIQYKGEKFVGWQTQPNGRSVQEVLENRLTFLLKENIKLFASGRTDAGVHAICQIAHFEMESDFNINKLAQAINFDLPNDVRVLSAKEVSKDFHARFNSKRKTYLYKLYVANTIKPLKNGFAFQVNKQLDLKKMQEVAHLIEGKHNFRAFCATNTAVVDFTREIYKVDIKNVFDEIHITVCGNGFLYNMVRIIVGVLVDVGKGKLTREEVENMLKTGVKPQKIKTMPAYGLYLLSVEY